MKKLKFSNVPTDQKQAVVVLFNSDINVGTTTGHQYECSFVRHALVHSLLCLFIPCENINHVRAL